MKKHFMCMMAAIMTCSLSVMFTACGSDDKIDTNNNNNNLNQPAEQGYFDNIDVNKIQVVETGEIPLYEELKKRLQDVSGGNSTDEEMMKSFYTNAIKNLEGYAKEAGNQEGSNGYTDFMNGCRLQYSVINVNTISADGTPIQMSTLLAWPHFLWEHRADHVILGCHATVTDDFSRPSNFKHVSMQTDVGMIVGGWASTSGGGFECLVIMPDYEGYGSTVNRSHPYLNRETQAKQCIDAVGQGIAIYNKFHKGLVKNYRLLSVGYSQGGAVAAAAYRYCLDHPEVRKALPMWDGAICGDGPYDPYATILEYCETNKLFLPVAPILMLKGLCDSDKEMIAAGIQPSDFMSKPAFESGILERIATKKFDTTGCDLCIWDYEMKHPGTFHKGEEPDTKSSYCYTSEILNKETYDYFKSKGQTVPADETMLKKLKTLEHCLKKNALWYKDDNTLWMPPTGSRFTFFHSKRDEVVGFTNLQSIIDKWGKNNASTKYIEYNTDTYTHVGTGKAFFTHYSDGLINEVLKGKWEGGSYPVNRPNDRW